MPATPTPPATIQVGPFTYTVHVDKARMNQACRDDHTDLLGRCEHRTLDIDIDPDQAPGQMADTLLHELLHALTDVTGLANEWDEDREEAVVRRLSPVLLDTLRRNPALVAYLTT